MTDETKIEKAADNVIGKPSYTNLPEAKAAAHVADDDGLDELPEGAAVQRSNTVSPNRPPKPANAFTDEHVGKGGVYAVGTDGVRRPVYDQFTDATGKIKYRPAV